ncbi:MAG: IS30 family transposase [Prevotellaceae bacterium]|jgi:IS30 family transposase|nr:IS30 family transposase [Prevotellaceae bacterium]
MNKKKHLTQEQRYTIARMLQARCTRKEICVAIGKDKSVISRELRRNSHNRGYSPTLAQKYADERKERFKRKRAFTESIQGQVVKYLQEEQWSPEQIVGRARRNGLPMVSHERIYQHIRADKAQGGTLYRQLRHRLKHRKRPVGGKKVVIPDKVSIDLRPDIINKKQRFGDWEVDTIVGPEHRGAILTVTERQTGFLLMKKLPKGKNAKALAKELFYLLLPYKRWVHSITSDNGSEFYEHKHIARSLHTSFFFAHPYSSWERGLNEYTNGLVRQYIPKKQNFNNINDDEINSFQIKINKRPRKLLNFDAPIDRFFKIVALAT